MEVLKLSKESFADYVDAFCELYHKTFTATVSKEIIVQRYIENPHDDLLMMIAYDNGKIAANYSAVPMDIIINGNRKKAALSLNTMTDPDYMGKGLFTKLANALNDELIDRGYSLIFGFPNYLSNRTFNDKLGWRTIAEIPTLKMQIDSRMIDNTTIIGLSQNFDSLQRIDHKSINIDLSSCYLKWRFKNNKEKNYHTLFIDENNWLIIQFYNDEINITEINCNNDMFKQLINSVIAIGQSQGYKYISTWYRPNSVKHSLLEKEGFRLSAPIRNFGGRCFDDSIADLVYDYRNWLVMMGDDNTY